MTATASVYASELRQEQPPGWPLLFAEELLRSGLARTRAEVQRLPLLPRVISSFEKTRQYLADQTQQFAKLVEECEYAQKAICQLLSSPETAEDASATEQACGRIVQVAGWLLQWDWKMENLQPHPAFLPVTLRLQGMGARILRAVDLTADAFGAVARGQPANFPADWRAGIFSDVASVTKDIQDILWRRNMGLVVTTAVIAVSLWLLNH